MSYTKSSSSAGKKFFNRKKKKTYFKKKFSRSKSLIPRSLTYNVHYFKRCINGVAEYSSNLNLGGNMAVDLTYNYFNFQSPSLIPGAKSYGALNYQFSIENITSVTEFTSLFDSYRINKVVLKIVPRASVTVASGNASLKYPDFSPNVHYAIDHDDIAIPSANEAGINILRQYPSYKCRRLNGRSFTIIIKPRPPGTAYGYDTALELNLNKMGAWIDCASTNIKHFGLKMVFEGISPVADALSCPFEIMATYYMSFKGIR